MTRHVTPERFDVCVVGGGLAGLCAALAAARGGARTALVTDRPVLGGNSSSEVRVPPAGSGYYNPWATETGIIHELIVEDRARNHDRIQYGHANGVWDLVLYDACRREPNLTWYLNTLVHDVVMEGQRIAEVVGVQSGSATTLHVAADVFVDASGDGAVGVGAGVPTVAGPEPRSAYGEPLAPEEPDDFRMGSTLCFRARDLGRPVPFTPPDWAIVYDYPDGLPRRSTQYFEGGYWWIELGWPLDTLYDNDQLRDALLAHVYGLWDHIKNRGREQERAATWVLDWVGMLPARRESRRFVGAHVLTQQELQAGGRFDDTVAYGGWCIDDHTRGGLLALDQEPSFDNVRYVDFFVRPYGVPFRSLYAHEVDNLLFAGRVLSASRIAFSSLRVQQTLATTGQAAGTAAALCALGRVGPADLPVGDLQARLLRDDAWLPGFAAEHLAADADATASSVAPVSTEPGEGSVGLSGRPAALLPVTTAPFDEVSLYLDGKLTGTPAEAVLTLYPAAHVWDLEALEAEPLAHVPFTVATPGWQRVAIGATALRSPFVWVRVEGPSPLSWRYAADDPLGTVCAYTRPDGTVWFAPGTWNRWKTFTANLSPAPRPYTPEQALTGVGRPYEAVNAWVSDPAQPLPQSLELTLPQARLADTVQLLFDTQLNRINYVTPGLFTPPECVRDYRLEARIDGAWRELAAVTGNYHRRRVHRFEPAPIQALRLTVTATNGDPSARVYGVWLLNEGDEA